MGEYRGKIILQSNDVNLPWVSIDRDLKFDKHVLKVSSKVNQKLSALSRMTNFLFSVKEELFLKLLWSLNLNTVQLFGCLIVDVRTTKLMVYMREPL